MSIEKDDSLFDNVEESNPIMGDRDSPGAQAFNKLKDIVEDNEEGHGSRVERDEPTCVIHRADHKDCIGCPSHLGCAKTTALIILMLMSQQYKPKNFEDMLDRNKKLWEMKERVLTATSAKQAHDIAKGLE